MRLLANIFWFFLCGWALFLVYAIAAVVFFPFFIPIFRLAKYSLWPFGLEVVTQRQLKQYRDLKGIDTDSHTNAKTMTNISAVLNVVWMITFGWVLALFHLWFATVYLLFFWLYFTIPGISGNWKMMRVALMPFNKVVVPEEIAQEIEIGLIKDRLRISA
jgi:uncharacterized membrane protein YccF (DUF307 family)